MYPASHSKTTLWQIKQFESQIDKCFKQGHGCLHVFVCVHVCVCVCVGGGGGGLFN